MKSDALLSVLSIVTRMHLQDLAEVLMKGLDAATHCCL